MEFIVRRVTTFYQISPSLKSALLAFGGNGTYRRTFYTSLQLSGKLDSYLADIDQQAESKFLQLVEQMARCQGVTEQLKVKRPDGMGW